MKRTPQTETQRNEPIRCKRQNGVWLKHKLFETTLLFQTEEHMTVRAVLPCFETSKADAFNAFWERLANAFFQNASKASSCGGLKQFSALTVQPDRSLETARCAAVLLCVYFGNGSKKIPRVQKHVFFEKDTFYFCKAPTLTKTQKKSILVAHFRKR